MDRFGDIPPEAMNLLQIAKLKAEAHKAFVTELTIRKNGFTMEMYPQADVRSEAIPELILQERGRLKFLRGRNPRFVYEDRTPHADCRAAVEKAEAVIAALSL